MKSTIQNQQKMIGAAAIASFILATAAPMAGAQSYTNAPVVLNSGTVIPVKLNSELMSNTAQAGDTFTATVDDSKPAYRAIMQGATVDGIVRQAVPQQGSNPGTLSLGFTRLHLSDGRSFTISGSPTSLDTKNLRTRSDGVLVAKSTNKDQHLTYAGYGAGAGLLVGILTGKKVDLQSILIGAAAGYGAGSVLKGPQQVHDVDLTSGTQMGVLLDKSTRYYHKTAAVVTKTHKVVVKRHRHVVRHTYAN